MQFNQDTWVYSEEHRQIGRIVETQQLWGEVIYRVWLPGEDAIVRVKAAQLKPLAEATLTTPSYLAYIAAAARISDTLAQHETLLAPIESTVIPLPHQLLALTKAVSGDRIRYLLADEVGLGKTIEAGLIMRELKLRGLVRRTLVVAPTGLATQWAAEMHTHFNEEFQLLIPSDFPAYRRIANEENIWQAFDQVIAPMDSVKPIEGRRGWPREQIAGYNRERFEDLVAAGWDLIIIDEAHRLGGSTDQVARYKLGQGLSEAAPYLLLLSATPHQGKTDAFHRLVSLLDVPAFPDPASVTRERVQPYLIRTEKRRAIDAGGLPLFKPRQTRLSAVAWRPQHETQRILYDAVTEYVRVGYNQAMKEKKRHVGFLMLLMQRLVTSSTRAIQSTLERRLEVLNLPDEQLTLFGDFWEEEWSDLDGQKQIETLLNAHLKAWRNEQAEVKLLLQIAQRAQASGPDAKAEALLDWIYRLQQEEAEPELKVLIFTEFVATQQMLQEYLAQRGFEVACLNGSMSMDERLAAQQAFAQEARVLISTDAGGEGLNLQFCHVVINYDIPWNPMRLEQRIGRVDRIGQKHPVRAINFAIEDTVEYHVREVLEHKLSIIFTEFGVDKTSDVLDSAEAEKLFDELYLEAILDPANLHTNVDLLANRLREEALATRQSTSILGSELQLNPGEAQRLRDHSLPNWVERMTLSYLEAHGGKAEKKGHFWNLVWPDGERFERVLFNNREMDDSPIACHLTLENEKVRELATRLPRFVPGQAIPCIKLPELPTEVQGLWSLWQISLHSTESQQHRVMPLFVHNEGRLLLPTARYIWEYLLSSAISPFDFLQDTEASRAFEIAKNAAESQGRAIYDDLAQKHREQLARERAKGEYAFAARRNAIARLGLEAVRAHRLALLEEEEQSWRQSLEESAETSPELLPLLMLGVQGDRSHGKLA